MNNDWHQHVLACPECKSSLFEQEARWRCEDCGYQSASDRDLRPIRNFSVRLELPVNSPDLDQFLHQVPTSRPEDVYTGPLPIRASGELLSEMRAHLGSTGRILDLGCGPRDQEVPIQSLGYDYLGIDYTSEAGHFLADAHALPIRSASFDCIFSFAVLEHLHNPFIALREIERVLKPGGLFVGTVSQGEPFHASYFHHTAWGLVSVLRSAPSLRLIRVWPSGDTLSSLARMGRYSIVIRKLLRLLAALNQSLPVLTPRKMLWPVRDRELDAIHRAGSICFTCQKM